MTDKCTSNERHLQYTDTCLQSYRNCLKENLKTFHSSEVFLKLLHNERTKLCVASGFQWAPIDDGIALGQTRVSCIFQLLD